MNNEFDSRSNGQGGFLAGLLCGAAVGAALGVVFAPEGGRRDPSSAGRVQRAAPRDRQSHLQPGHRGREPDRVARPRSGRRGREAFDRTRDKATTAASETYTETFGNSPYPTA